MRTLILVLLACLVTGAQAMPTFKNKKMSSEEVRTFLSEWKSGSVPKSFPMRKAHNPTAAPLVPIRVAQYKAEIYKFEVKKMPDGTYSYTNSRVCIINGSAPVYDARGLTTIEWPTGTYDHCDSTVGGQPATVNIEAALLLQRGKMFSDETDNDFKLAFTDLHVDVGAHINQWSSAASFTRDINQKSILGNLGAESIQVCKVAEDGSGTITCYETEGEYFSAGFELLD